MEVRKGSLWERNSHVRWDLLPGTLQVEQAAKQVVVGGSQPRAPALSQWAMPAPYVRSKTVSDRWRWPPHPGGDPRLQFRGKQNYWCMLVHMQRLQPVSQKAESLMAMDEFQSENERRSAGTCARPQHCQGSSPRGLTSDHSDISHWGPQAGFLQTLRSSGRVMSADSQRSL